jgi:hypothetical protein
VPFFFFSFFLPAFTLTRGSARLKRTWRSPIYGFFKPEVAIQSHEGHPCHFFVCAARKCKMSAGGVHRFQDSKDKASTANLKHHATKCFGAEAVLNAIKGSSVRGQSASIFSIFARPGQQPISYSHRLHTNPEVWWVNSLRCSAPAQCVRLAPISSSG